MDFKIVFGIISMGIKLLRNAYIFIRTLTGMWRRKEPCSELLEEISEEIDKANEVLRSRRVRRENS